MSGSISETFSMCRGKDSSYLLMKEYKDLTTDEDPAFTAGPIREDDFFEWEALVTGPEGTPFVSDCRRS
ncbi:Ubiquitin-conjugating enzyme E2 7, partial [Naganishia cerealis]